MPQQRLLYRLLLLFLISFIEIQCETASPVSDSDSSDISDDSGSIDTPDFADIINPLSVGTATLVIDANKNLFAWGNNLHGAVGNGTTSSTHVTNPVQINAITELRAVSACAGSFALTDDGTVYEWGLLFDGDTRAGWESDEGNPTPTQHSDLTDVTALSCHGGAVMALKSDGTVVAWGENSSGLLGNGTTTTSETPVDVIGLTDITALSMGHNNALALDSSGNVWGWGSNPWGELCDAVGLGGRVLAPVQIASLSNVRAFHAGEGSSLFILNDGTVKGCGRNDKGQLGDGTTTDATSPVTMTGISTATAGRISDEHSLILLGNGTLMAVGSNSNGQLGNDTTTDSLTPVAVKNLTGIIDFTARIGSISYAMDRNGRLWNWGNIDGASHTLPVLLHDFSVD